MITSSISLLVVVNWPVVYAMFFAKLSRNTIMLKNDSSSCLKTVRLCINPAYKC